MKSNVSIVVTVLLLACIVTNARTEQAFDGILSLTPVSEHSCISVSLPVTPGQPIAGLSWIHNDASTAFPMLLVMEGTVGQPPDLSQTALVLEHATGASLGTGLVMFESPIVSSTETIDVVFQLPPFTEKTADGLGGGPGIGYVNQPGAAAAFASGDGVYWTRLHPDSSMKVEALLVLGRSSGQAQALTELRNSRPAGWWDDIVLPEDSETLVLEQDETPSPVDAKPLAVIPNPFNPRTTVMFSVREASQVVIDIYDVRGRAVTRLFDGVVDAGQHDVVWEGDDSQGRSVSSGVYFVRMTTPSETHDVRAVVLR